MIDRIISFSVRRRGLVIAGAVALAAVGALAAYTTPVDAVPDLSEDQVLVFTPWDGHGPREVEEGITYPLSVDLQGIRGVRTVRGSSDFGFSIIHVIFDGSVDFAAARRRVAERLAGSGRLLPAGVAPLPPPDAIATGQIFWYTVEGGGLDLGRLRAVQDWYVRPQLASVPGVAEVASVGGFPIEYHVDVDPDRLRDRGATLGDVAGAVAAADSAVGGHLIRQGGAELIVRGLGRIGATPGLADEIDPSRALRDLESAPLTTAGGPGLRVGDVARASIGPGPRRGVLERDGSEVTGGVVLIAAGENPLEVTRRVKAKVRELRAGLPAGVEIRPFYDRTPLIRGAIRTVTMTIVEAMISASVCVWLVLLHFRASVAIALTLPLAALASFAALGALRAAGVAAIETNTMSLAGIAISVGVLVDSSIVMVENAMHRLRLHFGDRPVTGDVGAIVEAACRRVGRPIVFSVAIMLLSFLPVFALGGLEGKMFRPLAFTKAFALLASAAIVVTLVPALCAILLRGRLRGERASPVVRGVVDVYRPVLAGLLDRPSPLAWVLGATSVVGLTPVGSRSLSLATLAVAILAFGLTARTWPGRGVGLAALVLIALVADGSMTPIGREFLTPIDEGMVMDMPITVPGASVAEAADDLKARDMVLCRFPEVAMVVGKAGRAETATDPAPMDMIETMVEFRPRDQWPRRKLLRRDAARQARAALDALARASLIRRPDDPSAAVEATVEEAMPLFDAAIREYAYQRCREFDRDAGPVATDPDDPGHEARQALRREFIARLDDDLIGRGAGTFTRLAIEGLLSRSDVVDPGVASTVRALRRLREEPPRAVVSAAGGAGHHHGARPSPALALPPMPAVDAIQAELSRSFAGGLLLWREGRDELAGFGGDLDRAVRMPGWTNVWTMPIQNRVDMLATGVNTTIGVRVLGRRPEDVATASEAIAAVLKRLPGSADVVADPVRGKGYLEVRADRERAAREGVAVAEVNAAIEGALGTVVGSTIGGRERRPIRVQYDRDRRGDEQAVRDILIPTPRRSADGRPRAVPLEQLADVRVVEGPATIKSENGLLRNYVRLNARGVGVVDFVERARAAVAASVALPAGTYIEWTGQFEHEVRARRRLMVVLPIVLATILGVLWWTYHDLADALLMMLAVPGAIAGGVLFQWLFGFKFSVTVWVGYIACFGMATSTGIIMLVYLREAVEEAGGLASMDRDRLRRAVLDGAAHRLRPKLLTEGTILIGLAPMLWASGVGAEVIRPMAAPVLGGILVADEVIDLLLPVAFYQIRRRRIGFLGDDRPAVEETTPTPGLEEISEAEIRGAGGRDPVPER